jgi:multidrug efflux pump subunit AcrA (membrane-fusion protein)
LEQAIQEGIIIEQDNLAMASAPDYNVVMAYRGRLAREYLIPIRIDYPIQVNLSFTQGSGIIRERNVTPNSIVEAGQVLFVLDFDRETLRTQEEQLLERMAEEDSNHIAEAARLWGDLERFKNEINEDMDEAALEIHQLRLQAREADYDDFINRHLRQRARQNEQLLEIRNRLDGERLVAPFAGRVISVRGNSWPNQQATTRDIMVTLQDTGIWMFRVEGGLIDSLRFGDTVYITAPGGGDYPFLVVSDPLAHDIRSREHNFWLKSVDPSLNPLIFSDGTSEAKLTTFDIHDTVIIPTSAIQREPQAHGGSRSFINILEGNVVRKRYVQEGFDHEGFTEILDGLEPGQLVLLN